MTEDCRDLVCAASDLSEPPPRRLTQAMRRYVQTVGCVAEIAEPVAESWGAIGLAEMRYKERLDAYRRRRVDDLLQLRMHWNFEVRFLAAKWRPTASKTFGVDRCRRRQDRLRNPLDNLGICPSFPLGELLSDVLDRALNLVGGHRLDAARVFDLHLARH